MRKTFKKVFALLFAGLMGCSVACGTSASELSSSLGNSETPSSSTQKDEYRRIFYADIFFRFVYAGGQRRLRAKRHDRENTRTYQNPFDSVGILPTLRGIFEGKN